VGATDWRTIRNSDLLVIAAGVPRKPGMSRSDVLSTNVQILDEVQGRASHAVLIIVSNPVDVLTFRAWRQLGWPRNRIMGQAGALDSSRMASFVAMETGLSV
jgi:malate dehydrogenase